jgi:hypothetical protein
MLQTQSECSCDYYNVYSLQFFKSLGQLTAGLLSTAVIVPMYTYYSRNFLSNNNNNHVLSEYEVGEEDEEEEEEDEEDSDLSESEDVKEDNIKGEETLKELGYTNIN